MSARDDYPADGAIGGTAELRDGLYETMCDEIDRHRGVNEQWLLCEQENTRLLTQMQADEMMRAAVGGLVRELTVHADAMRDQILDLIGPDVSLEFAIPRAQDAVEGYENFIREA